MYKIVSSIVYQQSKYNNELFETSSKRKINFLTVKKIQTVIKWT